MSRAETYLEDDLPLRPGDAVAAVILAPDCRYVLQLRDAKRGIFFPEHWGFFGGGMEQSDPDLAAGLCRELQEELTIDLAPARLKFFTNFTFDFNYCGRAPTFRAYYEVRLSEQEIQSLVLGEGSKLGAFTALQALRDLRLVPYDEMALWMHANGERMRPQPEEMSV
jgi:8-oxo-dGTP pyrophosphatase MutT (NUDIX family)